MNAEENQNIRDKINTLLENRIIQINSDELKYFNSNDFETKIISKIKEADPSNETVKALSDYIEVKNYKILNAIKINGDKIFLNYLIRSSENISPKEKESNKTLGRDVNKHHLILNYDTKKGEITDINYLYVQYTPILFHKYDYNGKSVLYGVGNNSSSGMAKTEMYLLVFSTETLDFKFSDCILFSQKYYSNEVDDVKFEKDFLFNKDKIEIVGNDFDFDTGKYIKYKKEYNLF